MKAYRTSTRSVHSIRIWRCLAALTLAALGFPGRSKALENELLFGSYVYTLHNLETRGYTLSYRLWLSDWQEKPRKEFSFWYPRPLIWGAEISGGRVHKPEDAWQGDLSLLLKYEPAFHPDIAPLIFAGAGGSYSQVDYSNLSTYLNFIVHGGIGIRLKRFILEGTYEHRSNAGLSRPNRGVDLIKVEAGFRF